MISPLLLFNFTEFVEKDENLLVDSDYRMAIAYACGIIGLQLVERFSHALFDFHMFKVRVQA